jgi:hypothetical protein
MMLSAGTVQASRQVPPGAMTARPGIIPAPIGGWNQRDVLSAMEPTDAIVLENWIPDVGEVHLRSGFAEWGTSLTGNYVESLMQYSPPSGSDKLFAATPTIIYNVSTSGTGSSSQTSLTNGRWSNVMFSNSAGNYLYLANGADTPRYYDGSSWTNTGFTGSGLTVTNLDFVHSHLHRLWFIEKDTLNAWYGDTDSISGTLSKLILGPFCSLGGKLVAIGTWARDSGVGGVDDYIVFVTSKGQVIVYAGIDPAVFGSTVQVGVFKLAEPIGRRCLRRLGSDLIVITSQGAVSLNTVLSQTDSQQTVSTVTDKIIRAARDAYQAAGTSFGWEFFEYPRKNMLIMNVPVTERDEQAQFIMNTRTRAWAKFTGINAGCWGLFGDAAYFGGNDGKVYKYDTDYNDNGSSIVATLQTAFSSFDTPGNKRFVEARGLFLSPANYSPSISIKTDYDTTLGNLTVIDTSDSGTAWDTGDWDTSEWGPAQVPSRKWRTVKGIGSVGSVAFSISAQSNITFNGAEIILEQGGLL